MEGGRDGGRGEAGTEGDRVGSMDGGRYEERDGVRRVGGR